MKFQCHILVWFEVHFFLKSWIYHISWFKSLGNLDMFEHLYFFNRCAFSPHQFYFPLVTTATSATATSVVHNAEYNTVKDKRSFKGTVRQHQRYGYGRSVDVRQHQHYIRIRIIYDEDDRLNRTRFWCVRQMGSLHDTETHAVKSHSTHDSCQIKRGRQHEQFSELVVGMPAYWYDSH